MNITIGRYHIVGVAGVGMNGVAQALLAGGCTVSGSDRLLDAGGENSAVLRKLERAGIRLVPQDGSGVLPSLDGLVVSTAIEADNPDMAAAVKAGIPVIHRAKMLAALAEGKTCVAITGTAGKTTITGMVGWILEQAGFDPTVVNGGNIANWVTPDRIGNVRIGRSDLWVLEVDESDRSLLNFHPDWAVISNISKDHFELDELNRLFDRFAGQVKKGIVGCRGKPDYETLMTGFQPRLSAAGVDFIHREVAFHLPLLGRHNAENALESVVLCEKLGCDLIRATSALSGFKGIERRLEPVGRARGVTVLDDYAHNPLKIRAAWQAVAPYYRRVLAVWRPHGYGPLALMFKELAAQFAELCRPTDRLFILPVYYAGGTPGGSVDSQALVRELQARGCPAKAVSDYAGLARELLGTVRADDVVLVMGARDPDLPVFAQRLVAELREFPPDRMSRPA